MVVHNLSSSADIMQIGHYRTEAYRTPLNLET